MSIVGPRPHAVAHNELYRMKAHIDCDLEYLRNCSLPLDLFIIA
jgi:lipopolysaccharide/colanic/teichoic acid biosynthesis glycosyltransferase